MAISWISAFKAIPWSDVIAATPTIVQGAEKLWSKLVKQDSAARPATPAADELSGDARIHVLEAQLAELHQEVKASSALIKSLAEQNLQLVGMVDSLRRRTKWLAAACAVLGLATALSLARLFSV